MHNPPDGNPTHFPGLSCKWAERVSASLDGEVDELTAAAVLRHAQHCLSCAGLLGQPALNERLVLGASSFTIDPQLLEPAERRWLMTSWTRWLLGVVAGLLLVVSSYEYVRNFGNSSDAHVARHLAMWQVAFSSGVLVVAARARASYGILASSAMFGVLTVVASIVDLMTGHSAPITEPVHLTELLVVMMLIGFAPRHLLPRATSNQRSAVRINR